MYLAPPKGLAWIPAPPGYELGGGRAASPLTCHCALPAQPGLAKTELLPCVLSWLPQPHSPGGLEHLALLCSSDQKLLSAKELDWLKLLSLPRPFPLPGWLNTSQFSIQALVVPPPRTLVPGQIEETGH